MKERTRLLYIYLQNRQMYLQPEGGLGVSEGAGAGTWRTVRRCEKPPVAQIQGTSAGRGEAEAGGRNRGSSSS